ncbi:MAG TPA: HAD family hydrolase [Propionibacteriaceae bacterium]|nr:HAD family hydrolase [Propionibacteriaceae bacterium]
MQQVRGGGARQTLIFDADDTLWENNIYFKRVVDDYINWVAHPTLDRDQIRLMLNDIEAANIGTHGYGSQAFLHNLAECLHRLRERPADEAERAAIAELASGLVAHQIELMPGVAEALSDLGTRHELLLLTKGARDEQQRKVDASGLAGHFAGVHIVAEKDAETYRSLIERESLPVSSTWMIGNSPKSDIVAARAAGLRAVFIPHRYTWELEHSELDPHDDHVLVLDSFPELLQHF